MQQLFQTDQRQSDNIFQFTVKTVDDKFAMLLNSIRTGFIQRVDQRSVFSDILIGQEFELNT